MSFVFVPRSDYFCTQVPRVPFFTFMDWTAGKSSLLFHHYRRAFRMELGL